MSDSAHGQTKVISQRLKLLEDQKIQLQSVVDLIKNVLADGALWLSSQDESRTNSPEINQKIEKAFAIIAQKWLEISSLQEPEKCSTKSNDVITSILSRLEALEATISSQHNILASKFEVSPDGSYQQNLKDNSNSHLNFFNEKSNFKLYFKNQEDKRGITATELAKQNQAVNEPELVCPVEELGQFICQLKSQVDDVSKSVTSLSESTLALAKSVSDSEQTLESVSKRASELEESLVGLQVNYRHRQNEDRSRATNVSRFDEIVKDLLMKFDIVSSQVADVTRGPINFEGSQANNRPAFTAFICSYSPVEQGTNITSFTGVRCNFGGHFNPSTGEFTAPVSGVYAVTVTLWLVKDGRVKINVVNTTADGLREYKVCEAYTCGANISSSSFGVAEMKVGSKLSVKLVFMTGSSLLSDFSSFSCFRVG